MHKCSKMRYRKRRHRKLLSPPVIKGFIPYGKDINTENQDLVSMLPTRRRKTQQQCNDRIKWFENEK